MYLRTYFFLFFFISIIGFGQEFTVSGRVVDEQGLPISFANVVVTDQEDGTMPKGTTTDDDGFFILPDLEAKTYEINISFVGFKDVMKTVHLVGNTDLGSMTLVEDVQSLGEVSLVYKRPTVKKEADRLVFNVESSALIEGSMLQVLKSTPGVMVSSKGIVVNSFFPEVYINNRKVNLSTEELLQLLEGSSANAVKSVEVITNPSAKYDASSGAVLNIVLSKNMIIGYRGTVFANYTQGVFPIYNLGTSQFFKSEKVNFNANYGYTDSKQNRSDIENINYLDSNQSTEEFWESNTNRNKWTKSHNFNMNFDYVLDSINLLSLASNAMFLPNQNHFKANNTNVFDSARTLDFYYDANNLEHDDKHNLAFDLDFAHQFPKGNLSINSHFTDYRFSQDQRVVSNYFESDGTFVETTAFNTFNTQDTNIFSAKTDYHLPINNSATFDAGTKFAHIKTNSDTSQYDVVNGEEMLDVDNTDDFNYKEHIAAAYVNYSKDWEKWSVILGLRAEQTKIMSHSILNNQINKQDYLEWFPTTSLSYSPTERFSIYANYKRSIERPFYQNLNPFRFFYNDNNSFVGNPNLMPVITDHTVLGTSLFEHFAIEAYYKRKNNTIYVLPRQDYTTKILTYTPLNFDKTIEYGFDFIVNFYATEYWSIYFVSSFYNIEDETVFGNSTINQNQWSNYSILQNDISFLEDRSLNLNLTVYYVGKNLQGFRVVEDRWVSSLSISKSIFSKKAVISLLAEDLFNAQDYNDSTRYLNQSNTVHTNLDNRFIKLGFRYNFGNTSLKTEAKTKQLNERDRLRETTN